MLMTGPKKPLSEQTFSEQVATYLSGFGFLEPAAVVAANAEYVALAEQYGMTSYRCANNLCVKHGSK